MKTKADKTSAIGVPVCLKQAAMVVLSALMLSFCGCATNPPPGFRQVGPAWQPCLGTQVSPTVKFALTEWYAKGRQPYEIRLDSLPAVNQLNLEAKQAIIHQNLLATFGTSTPQLLVLQNGNLAIPETILSGSLEEAEQISKAYSLGLEAFYSACSFTVTEGECLKDEYWDSNRAKKQFAVWLSAKQFSYDDLQNEATDEMLRRLQELKRCADLKCKLLKTIAEANTLLNSDRGLEAIELFQVNSELDDSNENFAKFGDSATLNTFRQFCQDFPVRLLNAELSKYASRFATMSELNATEAEQAFNALEKDVSDAVSSWQQLPSLAKCLANQNATKLSDLINKFIQKRVQIWTEHLEELARSGEYSAFADFYSSCLAELVPSAQGHFGMYALDSKVEFIVQLRSRLQQAYSHLLPSLLHSLYNLADDAVNINGKPGASIVLCHQFEHLVSLAGDSPLESDLPLLCERTKALQTSNLDLIRRKYFKRRLSVSDFSSSQPALGMTYARDLAHTLENQFKALKLEPYITITTDEQQKLPDDDAIIGGVIADFDGSEQLVRESVRSVRTLSPVRSIVNPDFDHAPAPGEADSKLNAPVIFLQDEYEHIVHVRTTERQVHVRIFFTVKTGSNSELIELNEFYPRFFLDEYSNPQQDAKLLNTRSSFSDEGFASPSELPALKVDRLWSSGEMLDYARKDSLKALAVKVFLFFRANLLKQAHDSLAASDSAPLEAAEQFGRFICAQETFRNLTKAEYLAAHPASEATCSEADWHNFTCQQQEFDKLAENTSAEACKLADKYIRQLRQNKSDRQDIKDTALMF